MNIIIIIKTNLRNVQHDWLQIDPESRQRLRKTCYFHKWLIYFISYIFNNKDFFYINLRSPYTSIIYPNKKFSQNN